MSADYDAIWIPSLCRPGTQEEYDATNSLHTELGEASRFIEALTGNPDTPCTFQTSSVRLTRKPTNRSHGLARVTEQFILVPI